MVGSAAAAGVIVYKEHNATPPPEGISSGYTLSGSVNYSGTQPVGRIYLELIDTSGRDTGVGTSLTGPQAYTIPSIPTGTYLLRAWMDNSNPQIGYPNASSASGSITVSVNGADVSGQNISIVDPAPTNLVSPSNLILSPGDGTVLVQWTEPQDANANVLAQYYNVYYSTSNPVTVSTSVKKMVQANNHVFISGLTNKTTYYFVVTAVLGGAESSPSVQATVTVGALTGLNTVTGSVSFPVKATGPMYVGLATSTGTFFQRIDKPVSPQSYSISGVPSGDCAVFASVDMNNNGIIDLGDLSRTSDSITNSEKVLTVTGNMTGVDQTLLNTNVLAKAITVHFGSSSSDIYSIEFEMASNTKLPVKVTLTSGPNVSVPLDLGGNYYFRVFQSLTVKPKVGDTYVFAITYSDGTSETLKVPVTAVLDSFPQNLNTSGSNRNAPTFNWTPPASAPANYTYLIQVGQSSVGQEWMYPTSGQGMPSSQTSVLYNVDRSSSLTNLLTGTTYDWLIYLIDADGNQAIYQAEYTP